jgi:hypothetical protein
MNWFQAFAFSNSNLCRYTAVVASGLGRAGVDATNPPHPRTGFRSLKRISVKPFLDTIERATWARSCGAPWWGSAR